MLDKLFTPNKFHILDGAMGTMLQKSTLKLGQIPETLSITNPDVIIDIHTKYLESGSEIIYANTFGANSLKLKNSGFQTAEIVKKSIQNARCAADKFGALVALDIGPLGELLQPNGTLSFDSAYDLFKEIILSADGADLIVFETFSDLYELKAGILAAKENSTLPVICSMSFEENGRTFTGTPIDCFSQTAVGLGVDAIGINCGLGPKQILPLCERLCQTTPENFPIFVKPNAGLPRADGSGYDLDANEFAKTIARFSDLGVIAFGGCCGTTPEFIEKTIEALKDKKPSIKRSLDLSLICSSTRAVNVDRVTVVGERINPTGKKRFQQALRDCDYDYVLSQAIEQAQAGAKILDVNVGIPEIDETEVLTSVMKNIQSVIDLPLQLDSSSKSALEKALRYYNGKPIVNSVNGNDSSLDEILPLCKKYGACVIGLTLDDNGIPSTADERFAIAEKIVKRATFYGINKNDIYIDCLTTTISAEQKNALVTLETLKRVKQELKVKTALGVSNISFGLPIRNNINTTFLTLAMQNGLDLAIINPNVEEMMAHVCAFLALSGMDENCLEYIARYKNTAIEASGIKINVSENSKACQTLKDCVILGLKGKAKELTRELLTTKDALDIVDNELIPALDKVGADFESGKCFLPELLCSATCAKEAFEIIKENMLTLGENKVDKGKILVATVKGDIHDIGKNIVKVVLENYGYTVIDAGRDVSSNDIISLIKKHSPKIVGLSALMTTTLKSMQQTINEIKAQNLDCKIVVGGAVLTAEYAKTIGADFYAKDAKVAVDIAKKVFNN